MQITVSNKYESLRGWITAVPDIFQKEGRLLFRVRNEVRVLTTPDGMSICVKRFRTPAFFNRIAYTFFRKSKVVRAYNNAVTLLEHGIETPEPIAFILNKRGGLLAESYLLTLFCSYTHNFYEFREHGIHGYEDVLKTLALMAATMHENGICHRDFSPGNILFDKKEDGEVRMSVIDINRMTFSHPLSLRQGCSNFARLWGDDEFFLRLAEKYAEARSFPIEQCRQLTLKYHKRYWRFRK